MVNQETVPSFEPSRAIAKIGKFNRLGLWAAGTLSALAVGGLGAGVAMAMPNSGKGGKAEKQGSVPVNVIVIDSGVNDFPGGHVIDSISVFGGNDRTDNSSTHHGTIMAQRICQGMEFEVPSIHPDCRVVSIKVTNNASDTGTTADLATGIRLANQWADSNGGSNKQSIKTAEYFCQLQPTGVKG